MHVWMRSEPHTHTERQDQPNRITAKIGVTSTSATSDCTAPLKCYIVCTTLCLTAIISRPSSHTMSVPSLSSLPSTTDEHLTEILKHRLQWSQRLTPTAYHSAHSNVSSARCGQLQLLNFNDHVRSASTVDAVSFPGGSWLLSRGHTTLRNSGCSCFPPMLEAYTS